MEASVQRQSNLFLLFRVARLQQWLKSCLALASLRLLRLRRAVGPALLET